MATKDLNLIKTMKGISKRMAATDYRMPWQFRIEMDEAPKDFDLLVKSISQAPITIETTPFMAGGKTINMPTGVAGVSLALTCYDTEKEEMYKWMEKRLGLVKNKDGTWNLPIDYLINCKIYRVFGDKEEELRQKMKLIPLVIGDITESLDAKELLEFPLTFVEFSAGTVEF